MIFSYPHGSVPCSSIIGETFYYRIDGNKCRDPQQNIAQRVSYLFTYACVPECKYLNLT